MTIFVQRSTHIKKETYYDIVNTNAFQYYTLKSYIKITFINCILSIFWRFSRGLARIQI